MDNRLSFLFHHSNQFLLVLDTNGLIVHTNPALRQLLGYEETDFQHIKINQISHPADHNRQTELFKELTGDNHRADFESRIRAKNGRYYNIGWSVILNIDDDLLYAAGNNITQELTQSDSDFLSDNLEHIIQSFREGFFIIDKDWNIVAFNPAFQAITGSTKEELQNSNFKQLNNLGITAGVIRELEAAFGSTLSSQVHYYNTYLNRWFRVNIYPYNGQVTVFIRDITIIKNQQLTLALEKNVLEINASSLYTFPQTVDALLKGIEEIYPDMICSVLEVDEAQEKIYHLSAPRLPVEYCNAINGHPIGPKAGSCGTAAYHRSQVIVRDIETDPLWEDYRQLVLPYGIKACWSTPILSSHGSRVLATFAVYYTAKRDPIADELRMIDRTTNILRVLIENKRNQDYVKDQNARLQEIASISSHEIRRPVATIMGLVNLFDQANPGNPMNNEIITHLEMTAKELDSVIHTIVEKTIYLKGEI